MRFKRKQDIHGEKELPALQIICTPKVEGTLEVYIFYETNTKKILDRSQDIYDREQHSRIVF